VLKEIGKDLDETQKDNLGKLIEELPTMMTDAIVELAGRANWAPGDASEDIADALALMLKEDLKNGDGRRSD
jgi:hypothetical protein